MFKFRFHPMFANDDALAAARRREEMEKATSEDIGLMEDVISGKVPESQVIEQDALPEGVDPPAEEVVETPEPDAVGDVVVAEGAPTEEVEATPEELNDAEFMEFINSVSRDALGKKQPVAPVAPVAPTTVAPVAPVAPTPVVQQPLEVQLEGLVTLEDMKAAFESPEKMIEVITAVAVKAASAGAQAALTRLPDVARPIFAQENEVAALVQDFYIKNPELNNYRDFVQYCAVKVENEHPEFNAKQVFEETAKLAKQRLPMLKEAATRQKRAATKPGFVDAQTQKGKNKPSPGKMSALEQEIAAMPTAF